MNTEGNSFQWKFYRIDPGASTPELIDTLFRGYTSSADAWQYHEDNYLANERNGAIVLLANQDGIHSFRRVTSRTVTEYA